MAAASAFTPVGCIDEKGYLKGFERRGFTPARCLLELVANSLDATTPDCTIRFDIQRDFISMSDDGFGMDATGLANMFAMHRENHATESSRGVSGIGAKPALSILSEKKPTMILTRKAGGDYLKAFIPWDVIHSEGRFTGMITVAPMCAEEITQFGRESGTSIMFPYTETLYNVIMMNLASGPALKEINPLDRIGVVFGRDAQKIQVSHFEWPAPKSVVKYNYFGARSSDYYTGVSADTISLYYHPTHNNYRYIWTDEVGTQRECTETPTARGPRCDKEPKIRCANLKDWQLVGVLTVRCGLRRDCAIFNESAPVNLEDGNSGWSASKTIDSHTSECIGSAKHHEKFIGHFKLIRNGQIIGTIPLVDVNVSSARANYASFIRYCLVQCEVSFSPMSSQENHLDLAMQIQENKNQLHGDALPLPFRRLLKKIRGNKAEAIINYFKSFNPPSVLDEDESDGGSVTSSGSSISGGGSAMVTPPVVTDSVASKSPSAVVTPPVVTDSVASETPSAVPAPAPVTVDSESDDNHNIPAPISVLPASPVHELVNSFSPITTDEHEEEGGIAGDELQALLQSLAAKINPTKSYADPVLLQLFNQLQQCNRIF